MRSREVIGKPVVSGDGGDKLGTVDDLLLDDARSQIVGLVVTQGWLGHERVLPFENVQVLGRDAVVARSGTGILEPREWRDRGTQATRSSSLKHKRVMTSRGRQIGTVSDVFVNEASGVIDGYEIAGPSFAGLISKHSVVQPSGKVAVGQDAMIVSEDAAAYLESKSPRPIHTGAGEKT